MSRDITSQKQANFVRRELEQRRENFIYMTSHKLRTPLTVISGYCDFLEKHDQFIDHERRDKIVSIMKSNINRLERLTEDVAQVAKIEKDQFQVFKQEIDLCEFLSKNLDSYNQLLGDQFTFQSCDKEHSITIAVDPDRLQQVLENVISNAIKHTHKEKREITVEIELQSSNVQISISDNGAGNDPKHLNTIFEQFISYQTEYAAGGTGIGLYLSRKILEAHGGTITAQSEGSGYGVTFIIELPRKSF
ncbi:MAG: sensor histidine kinase [Candidatus Hodarchaeota archaeon]